MSDSNEPPQKKRCISPDKLDDICDLIHMSKQLNALNETDNEQEQVEFKRLNNEMLRKILPQLIELNGIIGMRKLKESLFYHILYYLSDLHTNKANDFLHTVIIGAPGTGKCLAMNTEVLLFDGKVKQASEIKVGDALLGDDYTPRQVISTCTGSEQMYTIRNRFSNDIKDEYIVNESHIMSVYNTKTKQVEDIALKDILEMNTYTHLHGYRKAIVYPISTQPLMDMYMFGYILATSMTQGFSLEFELSNVYIRNYFILHQEFSPIEINDWEVTFDPAHEYTSCFENLVLPRNYFLFPRKDLALLISGFLSSSGSLNFGNAELFFSDLYLFRQMKQVCIILGISFESVVETSSYLLHNKELYSSCCKLFIHKWNTTQLDEDRVTYPIDILPNAEETKYAGFELDGPNGRFMLANGVVTHNTSIAKIIGQLYQNMGILSPNGIFRIAKRDDFIAEYLGQTAIKTKTLLQECIGGVLFIDEVYALGSGRKDQDSFSKEAIDTLNAFLSEHNQDFCCIIAGYEEDVKSCFFNMNQGLERRFQWVHSIENYSAQELSLIFFKLLNELEWKVEDDLTTEYVEHSIRENIQLFKAFGGDVSNLITKAKMTHAKRFILSESATRYVISKKDFTDALVLHTQHYTTEQNNDKYSSMYT